MPPNQALLVIGCGALTKELRNVADQLGVDIEWAWLPAPLHNQPARIVGELERVLAERRSPGQRVLLGYGDCGTGGHLDALCEREGLLRLEGDHCYEFLSGADVFASMVDEELGTFYLTDYLARNAETLVFGALGIRDHPELRDLYFGNYRRVMHIAQTDDDELAEVARSVAERLGLDFERRYAGLEPLAGAVSVLISRTGV